MAQSIPSIKEALQSARQRCENVGIDRIDCELILAHVLGVERMELHSRQFQLSLEQYELFEELISTRVTGTPNTIS